MNWMTWGLMQARTRHLPLHETVIVYNRHNLLYNISYHITL